MESADAARPVGGTRWRLLPLAIALLLPAVLWGIVFAIFPPSKQNFTFVDDWSYTRSAIGFASRAGIRYYNWASMPCLGALLWAFPFIRAFGAAPVTLRVSTMVLACGAIAAFYDLVGRENALSTRQAAFATACLALNPLFFLLAATFYTDIPALAFSLIALALYSRGLRKDCAWLWAAATAVAVMATITRQNAVTVPLTAAFLWWTQDGLRKRPSWAIGIIVPIAACIAADAWLARHVTSKMTAEWTSIRTMPVVIFLAAHLLGLSTLPLLFQRQIRDWKAFILALVLMGDVAVLLAVLEVRPYGGIFPYLGDWFSPWGQFGENTIMPGTRPVLYGTELRWILSFAGCVSGAALITHAFAGWREGLARKPLFVFTLLHLPFLAIAPTVFDRYLLVLLPGAISICSGAPMARLGARLGTALLAVIGFVSLASIHDLMAWNSARVALGQRALARGIAPTDIEGGFAWDGWYAENGATDLAPRPPRGLTLAVTRLFFPHVTGRYALSFSPLPNSRVIDSEPYVQWLIPGEHRFYFVEETPGVFRRAGRFPPVVLAGNRNKISFFRLNSRFKCHRLYSRRNL